MSATSNRKRKKKGKAAEGKQDELADGLRPHALRCDLSQEVTESLRINELRTYPLTKAENVANFVVGGTRL